MKVLEKFLFVFLWAVYTSCANYDPEPPEKGSFGDDEIRFIEIESVDAVYSRQATCHIKTKNEVHLNKLLLCYNKEKELPEKTDAVKDLLPEYKSGSFASLLTALEPATTYYCRLYVETDAQSGYSESISFKTGELVRIKAWEHMAYFPKGIDWSTTAVALNDAFYFHEGLSENGYMNGSTGIIRYTPASNTWDRVADFPGSPKTEPLSVAINGKIYFGFGYKSGYAERDLWEYNPDTDAWKRMTDLPFSDDPRIISFFALRGKAYVVVYNYRDDITTQGSSHVFEFDPQTDTWDMKGYYEGSRTALSLTVTTPTRAYIIGGTRAYAAAGGVSKEVWEYDPQNNVWTKLADFGGGGRSDLKGFAIGEKVYAGYGFLLYENNSTNYINDFWEYYPEENVWMPCSESNAWYPYVLSFSFGYKEYGYVGCVRKGIYRYNPNKDK